MEREAHPETNKQCLFLCLNLSLLSQKWPRLCARCLAGSQDSSFSGAARSLYHNCVAAALLGLGPPVWAPRLRKAQSARQAKAGWQKSLPKFVRKRFFQTSGRPQCDAVLFRSGMDLDSIKHCCESQTTPFGAV